MSKIQSIHAREILNARGNPTVEATVVLDDGSSGIGSYPTGTSGSTYEATEMRDGDDMRFKGLGVLKAVTNIETIIAPKLIAMDAADQRHVDKTMIAIDDTDNKEHLGANAILPVSIAVAKAAAITQKVPLFRHLQTFAGENTQSVKIPVPIFNVINGGLHGSGALDFQEFILVPASAKTYSQSLQIGFTIYQSLKKLLKLNNYSTLVGDEGGFEPKIDNNHAAFTLLKQAIEETNIRLGYDVFLGLDAAANSFYRNNLYQIKDKHSKVSARDLILYYQELAKEFHIIYLEDILGEDDWEGWIEANRVLSDSAIIIGDDLTATNQKRLEMAVEKNAITGMIVKPNQIGTVIEALAVVEEAKAAGLKIIVAQRAGETNDDFIADFSIAVQADYVKFGAPARGERVAKYNRLLQIESELKK